MELRDANVGEQDRVLDAAVTAYLLATEAGLPADREAWLAHHPGVRAELAEFMVTDGCLDRLAAPLRATLRAAETLLPALPEPGRSFGNYVLLERLGQGGMGVVYKARQHHPPRLVALKMIRHACWASEAEVQRLHAEAAVIARLDHPHLLPLYEIGEHEGQPFFSMKLVEGGSLAERLPEFRDDPRAAARLLVVVARAVHHAHQRGVLHRDLKPSNILLDADGRPYVTDFGLARGLGDQNGLTQTGTIVGTPSYMAPEQARGHRADITTATDVYGLGALCYALLTGGPPFHAEEVLDTLEQVRSCEPAAPSRLNRRVGRDLDAICLKCLEKEPRRRYDSAEAVAADLERFLAGEPIAARPIRRLQRLWRWCRRNRAVAALSAAAAVLLVSLLAGLTTGLVLLAEKEKEARDKGARALASEQAQRCLLYVAHIRLAHQAWTTGDIDRMHSLLANYVPQSEEEEDLRGFEWRYLWRLASGLRQTLREDSGAVHFVAYSPDGKQLATAAQRGSVKLWDAATGELRRRFVGHEHDVNWVTFSPDGKRFATAGDDRTVKVWDAASGRLLQNLEGHRGHVVCVLFIQGGKGLASGDHEGGIKLWDLATGREPASLRGHTARVESMARSPDGRSLATASGDRTVRVWDLTSRRTTLSLDGHGDRAVSVAFSPDGRLLATGTGDQLVHLWDAKTGQKLRTLTGHQYTVETVAFSPDGRTLASGSHDETLRLWDVATGTPQVVLRALDNRAWCVTFSPDGTTLAAANVDGNVKLWDMGLVQPCQALTESVRGDWPVCLFLDGRELRACAENGEQLVWDLTGPSRPPVARRLPGFPDLRTIAPNGRTVVYTHSGDIRLGDWHAGLPGPTLAIRAEHTRYTAFTPDSRVVATSRHDGALHLWDTATGRLLRAFEESQAVSSELAFSPDGQLLATWEPDRGELSLVEVATGQVAWRCRGHRSRINHACFSPDGRHLVSVGHDRTVRVWDVSTGEQLQCLTGHDHPVARAVFSPDGRTIASGDWHVVKLWHVQTGQELFALPKRADCGIPLGFCPDGSVLACGGQPSPGIRKSSLWFAADAANRSGRSD